MMTVKDKAPGLMNWFRGMVGALLLVMVGACGPGDNSGIDGTGYASGRISAFGSIVIGDLTIDVSEAEILVDGEPATEDDLRIGMIVAAFGVFDHTAGTGVADRVIFEETLTGPVTDLNGGRFVALGQTVRVADDTEVEGGSLSTLSLGDTVTVSGFRDSSGDIIASWIDFDALPGEVEVVGILRDLDLQAHTFRIAELEIDFSDAVIEGGPLEEGLEVFVFSAAPFDGNPLIAHEVGVVENLAEEGDELDIAGLVTAVLAPETFELDGSIVVSIDDTTELVRGTRDSIVIDASVSVFGLVNEYGELEAAEIEFLEFAPECLIGDDVFDASIEFEGVISTVIEPGRFVLDDGPVVFVTQCTEWVGGELADLVVGESIVVFGHFSDGADMRALEIDFDLTLEDGS